MDRRNFLRSAAVSAVAITTLGVPTLQAGTQPQIGDKTYWLASELNNMNVKTVIGKHIYCDETLVLNGPGVVVSGCYIEVAQGVSPAIRVEP